MPSSNPNLRPRVFIGSSHESIDVAHAIQHNLHRDAKVVVWDQDVFKISRTIIEDIAEQARRSDFGIFVFAPTDVLRLRKKQYASVRDNVILEVGLFIGHLGRERTFVVAPENSDPTRVPSDLAGVTFGTYEIADDESLASSLGPCCTSIRQQIRKLGKVVRGVPDRQDSPSPLSTNAPRTSDKSTDALAEIELLFIEHVRKLETADSALRAFKHVHGWWMRQLHRYFAQLWRECLLNANAESRDAQHANLGETIRDVADRYAAEIVKRHDLWDEWELWHSRSHTHAEKLP